MNYNLRYWRDGRDMAFHFLKKKKKMTSNNTVKREFEVGKMEADGSHKEQLTIPAIYQKHHLAKMVL